MPKVTVTQPQMILNQNILITEEDKPLKEAEGDGSPAQPTPVNESVIDKVSFNP